MSALYKIYRYCCFIYSYLIYKKLDKKQRFNILWKNKSPCLYDNSKYTGFDRHYIYHPAWAARILAGLKPKSHVDISSILSFSTVISAFIPVKFYDFRPAIIKLSNMKSDFVNLQNLPFKDESISSLSCMHTIEHLGLGRYGDSIDPDGDLKAISEIKRVVRKNGSLLIVVPVGKPKIVFNAHRIYSYDQIVEYFKEFELRKYSLVTDEGSGIDFIENATRSMTNSQNYGCGCFWFIKNK